MNRVLQTVMRSTKKSVVLNQKLVNNAKFGLYKSRTANSINSKKPCCKSCAGGGKCESETDHHH